MQLKTLPYTPNADYGPTTIMATGRSASLDHESGTLYLLLFVTQTRPCTSGTLFFLSDGHGAGGVELAALNGLT